MVHPLAARPLTAARPRASCSWSTWTEPSRWTPFRSLTTVIVPVLGHHGGSGRWTVGPNVGFRPVKARLEGVRTALVSWVSESTYPLAGPVTVKPARMPSPTMPGLQAVV